MMNCIIVDDEEMSRHAIKFLVQRIEFLKLIASCSSGFDAIEILKKEKVDIMLLDIEMPGISGIDIIKSIDPRPMTILITSHKEYAFDAYEYNVLDYIIKPLTMPRLLRAVYKAKSLYDASKDNLEVFDKDYFFIRHNSLLLKILFKDILWIEAMGDYITINTTTKKHVLHFTLKYIEEKLPPDQFIRVHRSFIVYIDNITSVEEGTIIIGNNFIPVGAVYKDNFLKKLNLL